MSEDEEHTLSVEIASAHKHVYRADLLTVIGAIVESAIGQAHFANVDILFLDSANTWLDTVMQREVTARMDRIAQMSPGAEAAPSATTITAPDGMVHVSPKRWEEICDRLDRLDRLEGDPERADIHEEPPGRLDIPKPPPGTVNIYGEHYMGDDLAFIDPATGLRTRSSQNDDFPAVDFGNVKAAPDSIAQAAAEQAPADAVNEPATEEAPMPYAPATAPDVGAEPASQGQPQPGEAEKLLREPSRVPMTGGPGDKPPHPLSFKPAGFA